MSLPTGRRGILLDRDGTLIDAVRDADSGLVSVAFHPDHVRLLPGVPEGLRRLRDAGYRFAIVTNQPGPAKGEYPADAVARTNAALVALLATEGITVEHVGVCLHHPTGGGLTAHGPAGDRSRVGPCGCRKPAPGLLTAAMAALGLDPGATWMIGDSATDIEAGRRAGIRTAWLAPAHCALCPRTGAAPPADVVVAGLPAIAESILTVTRPSAGPRSG